MKPEVSFVGQPIRSLQTMLRVIAQYEQAPLRLIPDGIYGPETGKAVSEFQRRHGMPVTGVADQDTWESIAAAYEPALIHVDAAQQIPVILNANQVIRRGDRHALMPLAQSMLWLLSDVYGSVARPTMNGLLDEATSDSLSSFQMLCGLPMTGELDKITWKYLALQYPLAACFCSRP